MSYIGSTGRALLIACIGALALWSPTAAHAKNCSATCSYVIKQDGYTYSVNGYARYQRRTCSFPSWGCQFIRSEIVARIGPNRLSGSWGLSCGNTHSYTATILEVPTPIPTMTPTRTATPTTTPTTTPTLTPTRTPTFTPTATQTPTPTMTRTPTATMTPTPVPTTSQALNLIPVTPIAECIQLRQDGSMLAKFGYQNDAADTVRVAIGEKNKFTPGKEDVGQPTEFFKGRVANIISVTIPAGSSARWILGDTFIEANIQTKRCEGDTLCEDTNNKDTLARLDNEASTLRTIARRISKRVLALNTSARNKSKAQAYMDQAQNMYLRQWSDIWGRFPQVSKVCPTCSQIDQNGDITRLLASSEEQLRLISQASELLETANRTRTDAYAARLVAWAARIQARFATRARTLPRFESTCN